MTAWLRQQGELVNENLLRDVAITRVNQVWSTDITYIRLSPGFVYLVAIMDWFSRYVLSWEVSITLGSEILFVGTGLGFAHGASRDLQLGSRRAIHQSGIHRAVVGAGDSH